MSKPIRFLGLAICCWAGVRAISLGMVPAMGAFAFDLKSAQRRPTRLPTIQPTALPPIEPVQSPGPHQLQLVGNGFAGGIPSYPAQAYLPFPIYVPVTAAASSRSIVPQVIYVNPPPGGKAHELHVYGGDAPAMADKRQLATELPLPTPMLTPSFRASTSQDGWDRLSLSSWALMRDKGGPDSLSNNGMLGGSEAGARVMWRFDPRFAATLRASAPVNSQRGMEAALGLRYQPIADWPVGLTLERRHGFKDYGRNAFALFAESGLYGRSMPWQFALDGYVQAGLVDFNDPDWFVDGQLAVTRPVWRNVAAGVGAWGGAQPGLNRLDLGPRVSIKVGSRTRAHFDYRLNVAGNAQPGSGATVTLAGDF